MPETRYTSDVAIRGEAIYHDSILPALDEQDRGKYVLIDVESGDYLFATDEVEGADRMRRRRPDARVWFRRAVEGHGAVRRYGRRSR